MLTRSVLGIVSRQSTFHAALKSKGRIASYSADQQAGCSFWTPRQLAVRYASDTRTPPTPVEISTPEQDVFDFMEDSEVIEDEEDIEYDTTRRPRSQPKVEVPIPDRPRLPGSIKRLNKILSRHALPDISEDDLEESFIRGRGPGGQAINKTSSNVMLRHLPTGIIIKAQPTRLREKNREAARKMMKEKLDDLRAKGQWDPNTKKLIGVVEKGDLVVEDWEEDAAVADVGVAIQEETSVVDVEDVTGEAKSANPTGKKKDKAGRKEENKILAESYSREEIRGMKHQIKKANKIKNQKRRQKEREREKEIATGSTAAKEKEGV